MFGKKHVIHVLDNHSLVKHKKIIGIYFLTKNNFTFSNKSLILNGKEFKRCDKPHPSDIKRKPDVLVIFKNDNGVLPGSETLINQFNHSICILKLKAIFKIHRSIQSQRNL